jgi:hypothetical protein
MIILKQFKYDQSVEKAAQLAGEEYQRSTPQNGSVDISLNAE